jgi:hypothetical protein
MSFGRRGDVGLGDLRGELLADRARTDSSEMRPERRRKPPSSAAFGRGAADQPQRDLRGRHGAEVVRSKPATNSARPSSAKDRVVLIRM